ncbi:prolyl oligopeptidase family serine peptidase [Novosphingobium sp. P6W]|uniref:S9 family peptidase n=1 Tax=Novosphingobium sp. P6W TaxID=1609758 RepID=UPI000A8CC0A7|nr:prolyl oligopeptidase family serine peptidase [Novosphingobium sp. P6W]
MDHLKIAGGRMVANEEYQYAVDLWPGSILDLVRNLNVVPHWIGEEDRFWIRLEDEGGHRFELVDARTGKSNPAFDHARLAIALKTVDIDASGDALPVSHFAFVDGERVIDVTTDSGTFRVDMLDGAVEPRKALLPSELQGPGGQVLFLKDHDLWIREPDGEERALTDDGEQFNAWGAGSDYNLRTVASNRGQCMPLPTNLCWSPDGKLILAERLDERALEPYPYLELVPADGSVRPKLHFIRHKLVGEEAGERSFAIIDAASGARTPLHPLPSGLALRPDLGDIHWSYDGCLLYAIALNLDATLAALVEIEIASGAYRIVHEETAQTFFDFNTYLYNLANVRIRKGRDEIIWYSQRDGWGHLYAIGISSGAVRPLTQGNWAVADIIAITDDHLFFTAVGREPGRHPYHRYFYKVALDGDAPNAELKLLTPDDADHGFPGEPTPIIGRVLKRPAGLSQMSPSGRYFIDAVSRVDLAPRFVLRDADGNFVAEIARTDVTALEATGWQPPEVFTAKAADGETDLHGVLIKPRQFKPDKTYPVVQHLYGGPQILSQPRSFAEGLNGPFVYGMNALADLGFVVAVLDGPGTPYRSKAFHDLTYGTEDRWGIVHHRAALENVAATRPWMDLSRVGVRGHSFGGYGTVAALLLEPSFYKVGVSSAGMYDIAWAPTGHENYFGLPDYGDGRHIKVRPDEVASNHWEMSPSRLADRLEGQLLLVVGDLDENIQPAGLFHFSTALINAGKTFDQLVLPGRNHGFSAEAYFHKRTWDYFIEHLQHRKPSLHYMPEVKPGVRMYI